MGSLKVLTSQAQEPESQSGHHHHHHHSSVRRVVVTDVEIPFPSLTWFMIKCALASLPALLLMGVLVATVSYLVMDVRAFFSR